MSWKSGEAFGRSERGSTVMWPRDFGRFIALGWVWKPRSDVLEVFPSFEASRPRQHMIMSVVNVFTSMRQPLLQRGQEI